MLVKNVHTLIGIFRAVVSVEWSKQYWIAKKKIIIKTAFHLKFFRLWRSRCGGENRYVGGVPRSLVTVQPNDVRFLPVEKDSETHRKPIGHIIVTLYIKNMNEQTLNYSSRPYYYCIYTRGL